MGGLRVVLSAPCDSAAWNPCPRLRSPVTPPQQPSAPAARAFCYRCWKPESVCICALLPQVANRTLVRILQHPRENNRPIGTVRFAKLGLQRCEVDIHAPWSGQPSTLRERVSPGAALLFPSPKARPVETMGPEERPTELLVLDGTWNQVKALVRANPWLEALPHVYLATPEPSRYRIRAEPAIHYVSTLEAIVATLQALEPDTQGFDALIQAFVAMIDTQVSFEGTGERRFLAPKAKRPPHLPAELTKKPNQHLLVHMDTIGMRGSPRPIHVCAWRLATGERFECLVTWDPGNEKFKVPFLDLPPGAWETAVAPEELHRRWHAFLRPDDVAVVWSQRTLSLIQMPPETLQLKAAWCNLEHRSAGHLTHALQHCGIEREETAFLGELGRQMGELAALRQWLLGVALRAP